MKIQTNIKYCDIKHYLLTNRCQKREFNTLLPIHRKLTTLSWERLLIYFPDQWTIYLCFRHICPKSAGGNGTDFYRLHEKAHVSLVCGN